MAAMVVHFMWTILFILVTELWEISPSPPPVAQGLIRSPPLLTGDTIALGRYDQHERQNAILKRDRPDMENFKTMRLSQSHRQKRKYTMTYSPVPHAKIPSVQLLEKVPAALRPLRKRPTQSKTRKDGTEGSRILAPGRSVQQIAEASRMKYEKHKPLIVIKETKPVPLPKQNVNRKESHKYHFKTLLTSIMEISKALDNIAKVLRNAKQRLNGTDEIDRLLNKYIGIILSAYAQPQSLSTLYMPKRHGPYKHVKRRAIGDHTPITLKDALAYMISVSEREKGHIPMNFTPYQKIMAKYAIKQKQMRSILAFIVNPYLLRPTKPLPKAKPSNHIRAQTKPSPPVLTPSRSTQASERFRNQLVSFGNPSLTTSQHANMRHLVNRGPLAAPTPSAKANQNQGPSATSDSINEQTQRPSPSAAVQSSSATQPKRTIQPRSAQRPQANGGTRQFPQGQTSQTRSSNGQIRWQPSGQTRSADQVTSTKRQVDNQRTSLRPTVQTKPSQNSNRQRIGTGQSISASQLNRQTLNTRNSVSSSISGQRTELASPASRVVTSSGQTSHKRNANIQPSGLASSNSQHSNQIGLNLQMNKPRTLNRNDPLLQSDTLRRTAEFKPQTTLQSNQQKQSPGNSIRQPNLPSQQTHMRLNSVPEHHKESNPRKQLPNVHSRQNPSNQRQTPAHTQASSKLRQFDTLKPGTQKQPIRNVELRQRKLGNQGGQNKDPSQVFVNKRVRSNPPLETVLIRNHHPKNGKKVDISIALDGQSGLSLTMKNPSQPTTFIRGTAT
ncbi:micronuclear linker histone polyprotein-like [Haliotis asinina]|uniref:micronuclear linker histone polyprotein-like n=1 Tax=Haliotis asinina TaxID=109174 RepID=UPI00353259CD